MIRSILLANNHSTGLVTNQIASMFLRQGTLSGPISSSADSISFVTSISQLPSQSDWKLFAKWIASFQSYQSAHSNLKRWQRRAIRSQQNDKWAEYWEIKACKAKRLKTAQNTNIFCAEQNSSCKKELTTLNTNKCVIGCHQKSINSHLCVINIRCEVLRKILGR